MDEKITFKVKIGVMDLFRFLMYYNYKSFGGIFGVLISVAALVAFVFTFDGTFTGSSLLLLFAGLLFTLIQPIMLWKKAATQVIRNPVFRQELEYELGSAGIAIKQNEEEATVEWDAIVKIVESRSQILVYTSRVNACIWPKVQLQDKLEPVKTYMKRYVDSAVCK